MKAASLICMASLLASSLLPGASGSPRQHRGIWLHPEQFATPQRAEEWMAKIAAARLNVIYPLVWYRGGTAWFRSAHSPMAADVPPGFDPLGHLVRLAHAQGIQVHAWFVNGSYGAPARSGVFLQHPEWQLRTAETDAEPWYDLGRPEVRQFEHDVMIDCLRRYDIEGLHFDYIRYAGQTLCYCEHCQGEFSRQHGFRPLHPAEERFPVLQEISANPLDQPGSAQVLATFDHGVPAIASNRLGRGETLLLNWQAAGRTCLPLLPFLKAAMQRFGATPRTTFQLHTTQTAAKYHPAAQDTAQRWLKGLGYPARRIDETALAQVPPEATLVLAGQYCIDSATASWLEGFVQAGGHCLFVDGPVFAIREPALQRVTGMRGTASYFHDWRVISPSPGQDVLPAGPPLDAAQERLRKEKWVEYRKETVTGLVRAVHRSARQVKPEAWVSAAVFFRKDSADGVCQDWYGWLREGCLDYVLPMAYTQDNAVLSAAFAEWRAFDSELKRIIPGLSIYSRHEGQAGPRGLDLVRSQLGLCRDHATHGNLFFSLAYLNGPLTEMLAREIFTGAAEPWYPPRR